MIELVWSCSVCYPRYVLISHTGETEPCKCLASVIEKMPQQQVIQVRNVLFCYSLTFGLPKTTLNNLVSLIISQASQGILDSSQSEAGEGRLVAALSRLHHSINISCSCWYLSLEIILSLSLVQTGRLAWVMAYTAG